MGRRHLFLCPAAGGLGEMTLGLALARDLQARGDSVAFLAPSAHRPLLEGTPFLLDGITDHIGQALPDVLRRMIAARGYDDVVLIDLTANLVAFALLGLPPAFLGHLGAPVAALDIWSLDESDRVWDSGPDVLRLGPAAEVGLRLRPVPFVRPTRPGAFAAAPAPLASAIRRDGPSQILITTARWQGLPRRPRPCDRRLVEHVPAILFEVLARLDPAIRVLHVGPRPLAAGARLGDRYAWRETVPPDELDRLLDASRLLLTLNQASTVMARALARGVPAVAVINSHAGDSVEAIEARLPAPPSPSLREALARLVPLHPFRLWPLGLHRFMTGALAANPYADVVPALELLEEETLVATLAELAGDGPRRRTLVERGRTYLAEVAALPRAAQVVASWTW